MIETLQVYLGNCIQAFWKHFANRQLAHFTLLFSTNPLSESRPPMQYSAKYLVLIIIGYYFVSKFDLFRHLANYY